MNADKIERLENILADLVICQQIAFYITLQHQQKCANIKFQETIVGLPAS